MFNPCSAKEARKWTLDQDVLAARPDLERDRDADCHNMPHLKKKATCQRVNFEGTLFYCKTEDQIKVIIKSGLNVEPLGLIMNE